MPKTLKTIQKEVLEEFEMDYLKEFRGKLSVIQGVSTTKFMRETLEQATRRTAQEMRKACEVEERETRKDAGQLLGKLGFSEEKLRNFGVNQVIKLYRQKRDAFLGK